MNAIAESSDDLTRATSTGVAAANRAGHTFQFPDVTGSDGRFVASDLVEPDPQAAGRLRHRFNYKVPYEVEATGNACRRPSEWLRTLYRSDNLNGLLKLGELQTLALGGETYKLADQGPQTLREWWTAHSAGLPAPCTARPSDGERLNYGFPNVLDVPYPELVKAAQETHSRMHELEYGRVEPLGSKTAI